MIPTQLQQPEFRFIRTNPMSKRPIDPEWNKTGNFSHDAPEIATWIKNAGSYGVCTGKGGLIVLDFDEEETEKAILPLLPETFTIQSAGKGRAHAYYICKDASSTIRYKDAQGKTLLDVQGAGAQVIGPGSINRTTGRRYEIAKDLPITETSLTLIKNTVAANIKAATVSEREEGPREHKEYTGPNAEFYRQVAANLKPSTLLTKAGVSVSTNKARCPFHDDDKPSMSIDDNKGVAYCFACGKGWNTITLYRALKAEGYFK